MHKAKCEYCTGKCPQEELACEIARGRMYATDEVIRLQKEVETIRAKAIDEFAERIIAAHAYTPKAFVRELAEELKKEGAV